MQDIVRFNYPLVVGGPRRDQERKILRTWRLRHVRKREEDRASSPSRQREWTRLYLRRIATRTITITFSPPLLASARVDEERTNYLVILFTRKSSPLFRSRRPAVLRCCSTRANAPGTRGFLRRFICPEFTYVLTS